jgi:TetR/AcrR family transcriptional regulator, tetracycline repressor protein
MDAETITSAALDVLDEVGLDRLTMRLVAARLGVQVGGLYYYVPDKSALLRSMANEVCRQALSEFDAEPRTSPWPINAIELCACVRAALRNRQDAARVLAAGPLNGSMQALALMDRLIALLDEDIEAAAATIAADTLMAYVTGFVLQEQSQGSTPAPYPVPLQELHERFPRVFRNLEKADDDTTFHTALSAILDGFTNPAPGVADL